MMRAETADSSFSRPESFLRESIASTRKWFEFPAGALRFGQREETLWWFRSFVLFLIVVFFVCHSVSVRGTKER